MDSVNEANSLVRLEIEQGHWYRSPAGELFIVPDDQVAVAEIEGPDGETLDRLNKVYRRCNDEGRARKRAAWRSGRDSTDQMCSFRITCTQKCSP